MGKINRFLLMLIAMMMIMIAAVGIDRGMKYFNAQRWEKERVARNEQIHADAAEIQMTISQLANDPEAIEAFIEENKIYFDEEDVDDSWEMAGSGFSGDGSESVSGNEAESIWDSEEDTISGNSAEGVSSNEIGTVSGNETESVSGNEMISVSGNMTGSISGNEVSGNFIGSDAVGPAWSKNTVSGNTLQERRKIRASYMETQIQNKTDLKVIADNDHDFSGLSIACLGDSITQAANLDNLENYQQYSYPSRLKEILGAESMTNLGIGGSSIGRYWENAFVDRFKEIPQDTDLIIVMGGTNDGFCLTQEDFGTMQERKAGTFIGDLDELMRGLKETYPDAKIVFITPLPNVLHDMLRKERDYLLSQTVITSAIRQLSAEYEIPVIDLYNSNMLDTHDAAVIYNYMPDGVHCNEEGYRLLAQHIAAELIRIYDREETPEMKELDGEMQEREQETEDGQKL